MIAKPFIRTKRACHFSYIAMSSVFCLPPMLFLTFHKAYGISYTLLGTLVLANFCTQLLIDLIFSFFSKYFNLKRTVRIMPLITSLGLLVYAAAPILFGNSVYLGLLLGTVIFSVASGLSEVLLSPVISAIPGSTDKDMSQLHALYAVGVVLTVGISSLFLWLFGDAHWQILVLFWAALPLVASLLFCISPMPDMNVSSQQEKRKTKQQRIGLALCVLCIFLGSAAENTMTNWISSYMESALGISKAVGDLLGMAVFAVLLGVGRILYTKFGRNISMILLGSMTGAAVCYLVAGLSPSVTLSFVACILTGLFTSMLWPGSLILMEERINGVGVAAYALMAAGGDFGASVAPQLLGIVVDQVGTGRLAVSLATRLSVPVEQIAMKVGMLVAAIFPILGIGVVLITKKYFHKHLKGAVYNEDQAQSR